jgi:hypothetical protein
VLVLEDLGRPDPSCCVGYFHCSEVDHPIGLLLTGPATRNAGSRWTDVESTYESNRVYVFEGDGDPRYLADTSISSGPKFVYEVQPNGELRLDRGGGLWKSMSCESAVILTCVWSPSSEHDGHT